MKKKKMCKKISKITLAVTLVASAIIPVSASLKTINAKDALTNQSREIQNATGSITPVENEYIGNAKKKIFSSAHFKIACTKAFSEIRLNDQKLGLAPNKWSDISLSNVKKWLKEGETNKIEILFTNDIGELYVGGSYEFIYDITAPDIELNTIASNKYTVELGAKYLEEYTLLDNVSKPDNIDIKMVYHYNNNGVYEEVDSMNKVGNYTVWYNICDEAGNFVEKAAFRDVEVVDTIGPKVYPSKSTGSEVEGIGYYSYLDLKLNDLSGLSHLLVNGTNRLDRKGVWNDANYINLKGYYKKNKINTVEVFDIYDNASTYTFIYDIDKPILDVQYSKITPTNEAVTVTIRATNELYDGYGGIRDIEGWTKIDNQTYQKVFEENASITDLPITDFAGNVSYVDIDVNNIDKTFAQTKLTYSVAKGEFTNGNVEVILECDEDILTPEGWLKNTQSDGKVNYVKTFTENGSYDFELQDLAGNKKTITVVIDQIDRIAPVINGIENNKYYKNDVTYTIDEEHLDYVTINGLKYTENIPTTFSDEGNYVVTVVDKAGNQTTVNFVIDKTIPIVVDVQQKYENIENGRIKVNVIFSEPVKINNSSLWKAVNPNDNGYANEYNGYFYQTKDVILSFKDQAGNVGEKVFTVDKTAPTAQITYSTTEPTRNNVVATLVMSEDVNEEELMKLGWIKATDRTFNKEYASNAEETFNIYDLVGNPGSVTIKITNIDKKVPEYKPENWFITVEVDANAINPYLMPEQVTEILESQKQYITDDNVVNVVEDKWWNQNSSKLDIRKIGNYANSFSFYITDAAGNRINPRLTVKVIDTTAPIIDLGDIGAITTHELNSPFVDINPTATDNSGETISIILNKVVYAPTQTELETSTEFLTKVDVSRLGWYKLEYKAEDSSGNIAYASRIVQVIDTTAPEYEVDYLPINPTYDSVTVTITTNEQATITGEGWIVDSTGMIFTKVFMANGTEDVVLTDLSNNTVTVNIKVENIVNKDLLESFVNKCKDLDETKYTEVSWNLYYPVYEAAVEMLQTPHVQTEVDQMYDNLIRAYLSLRLIPKVDIIANGTNEMLVDKSSNLVVNDVVNKDLLEKFVNKCKDLDKAKYTVASWNLYYPVYEAAVEMLQTPHSQAEIDQMYEDLVRAYLSLKLIPNVDITAPNYIVEYSQTEPTYDSVTVTITTDEKATITGEGWIVDSTGMIFTKVFMANGSEDVVLTDLSNNAVTVNIKVENIVNKDLLENFVNKCRDLDETKYTEASWNLYYPVYEAAVGMLQTPHVQTEVDQMYKDLVSAYLNLRLIPNLNLVDNLAE